MKILLISRGYPTTQAPMNGIFEWDQAKALAEAGHRVVVGAVDLRSLRHRRPVGIESLEIDGIPIEAVHVPVGRIPSGWLHTLNTRAVAGLYRRVARRFGIPDVVHSHFLRMGAATVAALPHVSVVRVHTEHYSGLNMDPPGARILQMGQKTYHCMDQVVTVSTALGMQLRKWFGINAKTIPNPVDLALFYPPEIAPERDVFHFVATGHLLANKRMDLLVAGFQKAFAGGDKVDLTIFGAGPEHDQLLAQIESGPARERIRLAGHQPRSVVADTLRRSHAFALLSQKETFGLAYVEALATGLPVLAADSGGPSDFVRPETGRMVPADSTPADVAAALQAMVKEYADYDQATIARYAHGTFSPQAVAAQLTHLYEETLASRRSKGARI